MLLVAAFVIGCIFLVRGQVQLTRGREIRGTPARWIGAVLLLPLPLSLALGLALGLFLALQGDQVQANEDRLFGIGAAIELAILGTCVVIAFIIGITSKKERVRRKNEERDFEYRGRRRRRYADVDELEEAEPEVVPILAAAAPDRVACPACNKLLAVAAASWGKSVRCPACANVFSADLSRKMVQVHCGNCARALALPEHSLGTSIECPSCRAVMVARAEVSAGIRATPPPLPRHIPNVRRDR